MRPSVQRGHGRAGSGGAAAARTATTTARPPLGRRRRPTLAPPPSASSSSSPPPPPTFRTPKPVPTAPLGATGVRVPRVCLGTMLFGECTDYARAARLMSLAADAGAAFFDSAEMYPVPPRAETAGRSEEMLGRWANEYGRDKVLVATKVSGPGGLPWIRGGPPSLDAKAIAAALDASLARLKTDSVDLLQTHWPDRWVPMFGARDYDPRSAAYAACPLEEQLEALARAVRTGKARFVGLSNETAWGVGRCGALSELSSDSESNPFPRVASVQNAYSLLCRTAEVGGGVMEACDREKVGLLAYAPLAAGHLSGKYLERRAKNGSARAADIKAATPEARLIKYRGRYAEAEMRYAFDKPGLMDAVGDYVDLAQDMGITPCALAIRFVLSRPPALVPSAVIGATTEKQLIELLDAAAGGDGMGGQGHAQAGGDVGLGAEALERVDAIHERHPNPLP